MEKIAEISLLIDFYGGLLTEKQYNIIDMYYNNDYSLSEISEILKISRQGVFDGLKRGESLLYSYEQKLELVDKFLAQNEKLKIVVNKLKNNSKNSIEESIDIIKKIINENEI